MTFNGAGTDHGWSGNHFVLGGNIRGGKVHGKYPENLHLDSELNVGGPFTERASGALGTDGKPNTAGQHHIATLYCPPLPPQQNLCVESFSEPGVICPLLPALPLEIPRSQEWAVNSDHELGSGVARADGVV